MPNHVTNRITTEEPVLAQFVGKETHRGEERATFSFEQFIPSPTELVQDTVSSRAKNVAEIALGLIDFGTHPQMPADPMRNMGAAADALHRHNVLRQLTDGPMAKDLDDADFEQFIRMMRSYRACGALSWYEWNLPNWGTKWDAYEVELQSPTVLKFQTAWSAPLPVVKAFAKQVANFRFEWADEDTGSNVGWATFVNGEAVNTKDLSGTKEGYELAFDLYGGREDYEWNGAAYVWRDDD